MGAGWGHVDQEILYGCEEREFLSVFSEKYTYVIRKWKDERQSGPISLNVCIVMDCNFGLYINQLIILHRI